MTPPVVKCRRCGQENPANAHFCSRCMGRLYPEAKLDGVPTCELVAELKKREGVDCRVLAPYEVKNFGVEGPAVVLVVIDRTRGKAQPRRVATPGLLPEPRSLEDLRRLQNVWRKGTS